MTQKDLPSTARTTGVQLAQALLEALINASREISSPREHVVMIEVLQRRLEQERQRHEFLWRRWAA